MGREGEEGGKKGESEEEEGRERERERRVQGGGVD